MACLRRFGIPRFPLDTLSPLWEYWLIQRSDVSLCGRGCPDRGDLNNLLWSSYRLEVSWSKPYINKSPIWRQRPQDHCKKFTGAGRHCLRELEIVSLRRLTETSQPCYAQQMSDQLSQRLVGTEAIDNTAHISGHYYRLHCR